MVSVETGALSCRNSFTRRQDSHLEHTRNDRQVDFTDEHNSDAYSYHLATLVAPL